jgi:hypothetical protein
MSCVKTMSTMKLSKTLCGICAAWLAMISVAQAQLGGVIVVNNNGQVTVTWKGQQVYSAQTNAPVWGQSARIGSDEYAAALTGDTILWENVPGAAEKVKGAVTAAVSLGKKQGTPSKTTSILRRRPASSGLWVTTSDGQTTARWNGLQVFAGPTQGPVIGKAAVVNGVECAAVFDGTAVLWENGKGAAQRLK